MPLHLQLLLPLYLQLPPLQYHLIQGTYHHPLLFYCLPLYPSFSVLGPTIIAGHETFPKQVGVKDFPGRVFLLVLTVNTWTTHKTIMNVCLSHMTKIMKTFDDPQV
jgi:hypothetical protein